MRHQIGCLGRCFWIMVTATLALPMGHGQEVPKVPDLLSDPRVIAAIRSAWIAADLGSHNREAGFRLDGDPQAYRIVVAPRSNQTGRHLVDIIPGVTFALFHVHPFGADPLPSPADRKIA